MPIKHGVLALVLFVSFLSVAHANDAESWHLATIDIAETCNSTLEFDADRKQVSSNTANALYQLIRFAFDAREYAPDTQNSLYADQFGKNPSDITISRFNGVAFIVPYTIRDMENAWNQGLKWDLGTQHESAVQKIMAFRKKNDWSVIGGSTVLFDEAKALLAPILNAYNVKITEPEPGHC